MESAHEIAAHIIETAKDGVKVKPEELEPAEAPKAGSTEQTVRLQGAPGVNSVMF